MNDVVLHVGPVKTGSTYLQALLWRNRADLPRQGYLLPIEHDNQMWLAANDVQDGAFIHFDMPEAAGAWQTVRKRALGFEGTSVLSHEVLGMSTDEHVERIADALAPARLHVVVMARSLAATLPSLWQEKIKMVDPDISWTDFVAEQRATAAPVTDASSIVQRWLRHVPASGIHVVTVPPRGADPGVLLSRFAAATGIDVSRWSVDEHSTNPSLDRVQTELLRRLNQAAAGTLDRRARRRLVQRVLPYLEPGGRAARIRLPATERAWIEAETRRRVGVLERSGVSVHGDLADLETPPDTWEEQPSAVSDHELLASALLLLARSHPDPEPDRLDHI
jgi:hypothetical protein